jgi:hypothetical protein
LPGNFVPNAAAPPGDEGGLAFKNLVLKHVVRLFAGGKIGKLGELGA